jgi:hypothetical protein
VTPRIGVVLTTCGRLDYTQRTLETFAAHNDLSAFSLFHGDDASLEPEMIPLVGFYGFETLVRVTDRDLAIPERFDGQRGHWLRWEVLRRLARRGLDWVLVLENDIESVRPFPWPLFRYVAQNPAVYCLRLYGAFKDAAKREPCKNVHQWKTVDWPVRWKPMKRAPEPAEIGQIHWSAQPAVTRFADLWALYSRERRRELTLKTARVVDNVMVHIGTARTRDL